MKRVIITVADHDVGAILGALTGTFQSLTVEDMPASPENAPKARRKGYKVYRAAPARDAVLAYMKGHGGRAGYLDVQKVITDAGFSLASLSSMISALVRAGLVRRSGRDMLELVPLAAGG